MKYTCKACGRELPADMTRECECVEARRIWEAADDAILGKTRVCVVVDPAWNFMPGDRLFWGYADDGRHIATLVLRAKQNSQGGDMFSVAWTSTKLIHFITTSITTAIETGDTLNLTNYSRNMVSIDRDTWLAGQDHIKEMQVW